VDDFFARAVAAQPSAFACQEGCSDCCAPRLSVLRVEADSVRRALADLPADLRARVAAQADEEGPCPLLVDRRCAIYADRPVLCRSHGLVVRADAVVATCPLNYRQSAALPSAILDLGNLTTVLVLVNRLYLEALGARDEGERVALADLVRIG
jgi:Fe-S-cluster containining protein